MAQRNQAEGGLGLPGHAGAWCQLAPQGHPREDTAGPSHNLYISSWSRGLPGPGGALTWGLGGLSDPQPRWAYCSIQALSLCLSLPLTVTWGGGEGGAGRPLSSGIRHD